MICIRYFAAIWCVIFASMATAHEFWIEPGAFQVTPGEQVTAQLRNGQHFEGISLSYFDRNISRFDVATGEKVSAVEGRMGDSPALAMTAPEEESLMIVLHETTPSFVTYKEWEKFEAFAKHKDFPGIAERHKKNGFGPAPFKERYTRHAKALIAVGDGAGSDRAFGLKTEFVALTNPYEPAFDGMMRVKLLYLDAPRSDAQVEVFDRAPDDTVKISLYRTDAEGIAAIPVLPGHEYLFDGVVLRPAQDSEKAVWDTFWAALTFAVPTP